MPKFMITALPLAGEDRIALVQCANRRFEYVLERMEPEHPELVRKLWSAESYVDSVLGDHMLPIDLEYALGITEAFLVSHVAELAAEADTLAGTPMQ